MYDERKKKEKRVSVVKSNPQQNVGENERSENANIMLCRAEMRMIKHGNEGRLYHAVNSTLVRSSDFHWVSFCCLAAH
jgi:hypothetical protein